MGELTHFNDQQRARMVDVTDKAQTSRAATAEGFIHMRPDTLRLIREGGIKKGDVLAVAQVAGIMAAKRTHELIPMCHPIGLTAADITFTLSDEPCGVRARATTRCHGETGVEMEALTACTVALLTIYDMCKAVQRDMELCEVRLLEKHGGNSGDYTRDA